MIEKREERREKREERREEREERREKREERREKREESREETEERRARREHNKYLSLLSALHGRHVCQYCMHGRLIFRHRSHIDRI